MAQFNSPTTDHSNRTKWYLLGGCVFLFLCFGCLALTGLGYYTWTIYSEELIANAAATEEAWEERNAAVDDDDDGEKPTTTPVETAVPTATHTDQATPSPTPAPTETETPVILNNVPDEIDQAPIPERGADDLEHLLTTNYPPYDYFEVAIRLGKEALGPRTIAGDLYEVGSARSFYNDTDRIDATLVAVTEHAYFWVHDSLDLDAAAVEDAANRFEDEFYDRLINLFGDVWSPGVDEDPRITILHVENDDSGDLGYFVSENEYPRSLFRYSNEQEMVYLNMDELHLGSDLYFATMVHEVQHLIQWYVDPSETAWLNEGLSQLAEIYLGFTNTADTIDYLQNPDTRLNSWEYEDEDAIYAHYDGAYLFSVYLWEQLGEDAIRELSRHPANGMAAIYAILEGYLPDTSLAQFTADWAAANYLDDPDAGPIYHYQNLNLRRPSLAEKANPNDELDITQELDQFAVDYIDLNDLRGETTITFAGNTNTPIIGAPPRSGEVIWYAPAVNDMNAQLTASFDLRNVDTATLKYAVWYDLEDEYDFAYVSISSDGGETWDLLMPSHHRSGEYGPAYNDRSVTRSDAVNGWLKESISLNPYVGHVVLIRFDVLTDSGVTGQGFAIDDISIPELGYETTIDDGIDGWQAEGFVNIGWQLPQQWSVQLIEDGPTPKVTPLPLNELNQGQWIIDVGKGGGVLVIMPQTPFINEPATYWLHVEQ